MEIPPQSGIRCTMDEKTRNELLSRNTRNGVVSWQSVAKQLGVSIDHAKAIVSKGSERAEPAKAANRKSLRDLILIAIDRTPLTSDQLAGRLRVTTESVRLWLQEAKRQNLAHPHRERGMSSSVWVITPQGRIIVQQLTAKGANDGR